MGEYSDTYLQRRQLIEQVLDRIAEDPTFRTRLLDDPQAALQAAGFTQALEKLFTSGDMEGAGYSGASDSTLGTDLLFAVFAALAGVLPEDRPASRPDIDRSNVIDYTRLKEMG